MNRCWVLSGFLVQGIQSPVLKMKLFQVNFRLQVHRQYGDVAALVCLQCKKNDSRTTMTRATAVDVIWTPVS